MADDTVDWNNVRRWLVGLTDDLREAPIAATNALLDARKDIATALIAGQIESGASTFEYAFPYQPHLLSLPPSKWVPYDAARPVGIPPNIGHRVVRRTLGLPYRAVQFDSWPESKLSGCKPSLSHGPFLDRLDRTVYFDVFKEHRPLEDFAFPESDSSPFLYTTATVTYV